MRRLRWPGALLIGLLALSGALGIALWMIFDPPFLTWQHGAELAPALAAYAEGNLPGLEDARVERVRSYTETCSVIRASARGQDGRPGLTFWALLYREDEAWQVFQIAPENGLAPLLAWGDLCGASAGPLLPPALP